MVRTRTYPTIRISNASRYDDPEHKPASLRIPEKERNDSNANRTCYTSRGITRETTVRLPRAARRSGRMDQTTPAHRLPRAVRHPHQRGHADRVRAHTSAVPAEPGQSKFRSARTRPLVHRADIHAVRAESGPSAHRRSAHAGCVRPGRIGDRQNQNRMGVRHHHTGWRGLGHGTVLPIRRAQPPMACDLA